MAYSMVKRSLLRRDDRRGRTKKGKRKKSKGKSGEATGEEAIPVDSFRGKVEPEVPAVIETRPTANRQKPPYNDVFARSDRRERRGNRNVDSNVTFCLDTKSNQSAAADKTWTFLLKSRLFLKENFQTSARRRRGELYTI
jgi:hypothetical protein